MPPDVVSELAAAPPLVGRATELERLAGLLSRARLVTVMGVGGVGKTSLALRAVAQVAPGFDDGVCVVRLSALSDGNLLPHTVAARLGLAGQDDRTAMDVVLDYLRDRETLLVLDTCEHLIDACAGFADAVLERTSRVTVLATSRQPLDVDGENICPLYPLRVPPADEPFAAGSSGDATGSPGDATGSSGDATELFAMRAAAAAADFRVTAGNRRDVVTICERLDGIPLAIELAAVRLRTLPLPELARLLTDRLAISDSSRTEARHRTLHAAIGWSYDLCTPAERALWERLSVFAGSFGTEAAQEVCAGRNLPRDSVAGTLFSLVDKSVLIREKPVDGGRSRYRFLDTIREFGAERLAASGTETGVQDRFIALYRAKARYFWDRFLDDHQLERLRELAREHANVRAALEYTLESSRSDRVSEGAELATDLYGYWMASSRLREGGYWLEKVLRKFPGRTRQRARALVVWSALSSFEGKIGKGVSDAREAIAIAEEIRDEPLRARGYLYLNFALTFGGQYAEAASAGDEAERLLERAGDHTGLLCLDGHMQHMYQLSGDFEASDRRYRQGLRRFGASREQWLQGYLHTVASMSLFQQPGREAECAAIVSRALLAKHQVGDILGIGFSLEVFAWLASRAGRQGRCAWLLGAADVLWERTGQRLSNTEALEQVHQQAVQAARDVLGDQGFDTLWTMGRSYPLDGIVKLAVADADDLPGAIPAGR